MFDLKRFLEDVGRNIGQFTGATKTQPASVRNQSVTPPQPASTRQQNRPVQQPQQRIMGFGNPSIDIGKFGADVFNNIGKTVTNISKPISQGGANPLADAASFTSQNVVKPLVDTSVKAANTAAFVPTAIAGQVTGNKDIQRLASNQLNNALISREAAQGKVNPIEFGRQFTQAGVDVANVIPAGRAVNAVTQGTKLGLSNFGKIVANNARQAAVYGTANTANDAIQGRKITGESLAANYLAPAALGTGAEVAGALVRPALRQSAQLPSRVQNYGLARPTNLTDNEINASFRVRQAQEGYRSPQELTTQEISLYNQAQAKLGARPGTPDGDMAVVNALAAQRNFDTQRASRQIALQEQMQKVNELVRRNIPGGTLDPNQPRVPRQNTPSNLPQQGVSGQLPLANQYASGDPSLQPPRLSNPTTQAGLRGGTGEARPLSPRLLEQDGVSPIKGNTTLLLKQRPQVSEARGTDLLSPLIYPSVPVRDPQLLSNRQLLAQPQTKPLIEYPYRNNIIVDENVNGNIMNPPDNTVPLNIPSKKTRYADQTVPNSEFVGEKVSNQTRKNAPSYTPETERGRYAQTLRNADQMGFDNFENDVQIRLQDKFINSQTVADSQAVAQRLEAKGDESSLRKAAEIYDKLSEKLTQAGQTIQAAAILSRRTPEGIKYQALRELKKEGVSITPQIQTNINKLVTKIAEAQPASDQKKIALAELAREIEKNMPNGVLSNAVSVWKAGLLSGLKTTQGNIISNAAFGGLSRLSNPITVLADNAMELITGKRTATGTTKGIASGTKEGIQRGIYTTKTGIDIRDVKDKFETHKGINFENKTVQKFLGTPAQKVFDFMSAQDQPFYYAQLKNSMYDIAKAEALTKGLSGKSLKTYIDNTVANPSDQLMQRATDEAYKAVLSYDTAAYKFIQKGKQGIKQWDAPEPVKDLTLAVVDVLAPFTRVPTAFLARAVDYTPLGIPKQVFLQVADKKFDQRDLAKAIGEGITGTGIIALGAGLTNVRAISGDYPDSPKEQARWRAEGITPNSVKLGDSWYSLNYMGPIGMLFGAGKKYIDASKEGADAISSASAGIAGFGQTLLGQSFLQGLSGFIDAAKDPKRYFEGFIERQSGSSVPSIINDFANITDPYRRDANGSWEAIKGRIPLLRQTLNAQQDVYGNKLEQNALNTVNALKPSPESNEQVIDEVSRLANIDKNNDDLQITPTSIDKSIQIGENRINLTNQQRYDLQTQVGQATQEAWRSIINSPEYQQLSDIDKASALSNARKDIAAVAQRDYIVSNNLGTYEKGLTKSQALIANGNSNLSRYVKSGDSKTGSDLYAANDAEYNTLLADYNQKVKDNSYTPAQKIKAETALNKAKVGSQFSKETRDLYGLSKSQLTQYVNTNPDGKRILEDVLAYGDALKDAGINSYNKFRNSRTGAVSLASNGRSGGSRGGRRSSAGVSDYIAGLSKINNLASSNQDAIRKLVRGTKITRKKIQGGTA